jgi:hypothetical protein
MSGLNLYPSICFILLLALSPYLALTQEGELALFLDDECSIPSQLAPTASLALSTCLVPVDVYGIAVKTFPACDNGTASLIMYKDTSCSRSDYNDGTGSYTGYTSGTNCFYYWVLNSIPGVMFTCEEPATDPQATSTTTVTASAIAGVAAPVSSSTAAEAGNAALTTATGAGSAATSNANASPSASSTSSSGLSTSDRIAIGVGLGVGVPSIVIALLAWCYPR